MDIRDVKESPVKVESGKYLEKIYELQTELLNHYVKIEGIPLWPIDVNTKKSQVLLKDFTGRVTEELAEGFESHLSVGELTEANKLWFGDSIETEKYNEMISHLQNLNEEQADAMHFMVELLMYANILPEDIQAWVDLKVKEYGLKNPKQYKTSDIINNAMLLGRISNEGYFEGTEPKSLTCLVEHVGEEELKYLPGGRLYNNLLIEASKCCLWDVTYALNISRNCLKNKPWKQSGVMTNEALYQSKLVEAFVYMVGYWSRLGMTSESVYYLYFKKNCINQFRIKSKY